MVIEQRIPLDGTTVRFDTANRWEVLMCEPFPFGAGPWHFARGSVAAKLSSGADVTGEGAEMEFDLAREPLLDALRFAIEADMPTIEVIQRINKGGREMEND